MSLKDKIKGFMDFSAKRNFAGFDAKAFLEGKPQKGNEPGNYGNETESEETEKEETEVGETPAQVAEEPKNEVSAVEKLGNEVRAFKPQKIATKDINQELIEKKKAELAELEAQVKENDAKAELAKLSENDAELLAAADEADAKAAAEETPTETSTEDNTPSPAVTNAGEAGAAKAEALPNKGLASADGPVQPEGPAPESTPGTGGEAAAIAEAKALAAKDQATDYDGVKVADASGRTHTIVKRGDGYYIKGTNSKIMDLEGTPTAKYRTLGNAVKNGMNVNDYVKSRGGWAKYNKELKSGNA